MKRVVAALAFALALSGCVTSPAPAPGRPTVPSEVVIATPAHTATPLPPTPVPVTPSPAPTPSPTPDPFWDCERTDVYEGFFYVTLNDALKTRITGMSYPADDTNAKISYDDLRYLRIRYVDFSGEEHEGELIVNKALAKEVTEIFHELYLARYPLTSVRLVDDFGEPGDDNLSMAANNTSAFNYRRVSGTNSLSRHSYGAAIDVNPMLNPYVKKDRVAPENGAPYVDRTLPFAGKIDEDDLCYRLFTAYGWSWGGHFKTEKDYQHFSKTLS